MPEIATAAAAILALVLLVAASQKVRDVGRAAEAFRRMRTGVAPQIVIGAEVVVAIALLARPRIGGFAALLLLGAFTAVIVRAVRRPDAVSCSCFGASTDSPVDGATVVRNVLLLAVAATALGASHPRWSVPGTLGATALFVAGTVAHGLVAVRTHLGRAFPSVTSPVSGGRT